MSGHAGEMSLEMAELNYLLAYRFSDSFIIGCTDREAFFLLFCRKNGPLDEGFFPVGREIRLSKQFTRNLDAVDAGAGNPLLEKIAAIDRQAANYFSGGKVPSIWARMP